VMPQAWYEVQVSAGNRLEALRQIPIFADLDEPALERILAASVEQECPAGQVLASVGEPGTGLFVVTDGVVVVEAGRRTIELGPGEFFGELALLVPASRRVARVRAKTPVRCLAISRLYFEELLENEPRIALAMLPILARRLWEVMRMG
jgi:CRP-like cAMP-binding protein